MRCITLTQPWATLVALGQKKIETRSWATSYRGPLAIHAAKGVGPVGGQTGLHALCGDHPFCDVLLPAGYSAMRMPAWGLPLGAIVAVCTLAICLPIERITTAKIIRLQKNGTHDIEEWLWTENEKAFGDYSPGRFAWLLADIRALPEPILAKGALGLWEWEGAL